MNLKRKLHCYVHSLFENLALKNTFVYHFYMIWIGTILAREFHLADVKSHETVLHIGCGSLPIMATIIAKKADAKVIALDNNAKAVEQAQRYIARHKLTEYITVVSGDGASYPVESFDVIVIAINVTRIEDVLQHLALFGKPNVRIICRDMGDGVLHVLQSDEFARLFLIHARETQFLAHTFLITKNNGEAQ